MVVHCLTLYKCLCLSFSHRYCRKQFIYFIFCLFITAVNIRSLQGSYKNRQILPTLKQQLSLNSSWNVLWNTWKQKQTRSRLSGSSCRAINKDLVQGPILIWLLPYLSPEVEKWRWQLLSKLRVYYPSERATAQDSKFGVSKEDEVTSKYTAKRWPQLELMDLVSSLECNSKLLIVFFFSIRQPYVN